MNDGREYLVDGESRADGPSAAMGDSWAEGTGAVRSVDGVGSALQVIHAHRRWHVPLERPVLPVQGGASPARVIDARSGVVPYVDLGGRVAALSEWIGGSAPFAVAVIEGEAGAGKTRLAVELCRLAASRKWISGMLRHSVDTLGLADLADTPAPRLVIVDGGENRRSQLQVVLPTLELAASAIYPLRVAVLVRSARGGVGTAREPVPFGARTDADDILDEATLFDLGRLAPSASESRALLETAGVAFLNRRRATGDIASPQPTSSRVPNAELPLSITVRALLWADGHEDLLHPDLMEALLRYEEESWVNVPRLSHTPDPLFRRRVVALGALAGARGENEAAQLLAALPDLTDATRQERQRLARWVHALYPGPLWWNPMARGPLAEHLVADSLRDLPGVIAAVLTRGRPESLVQPLAMLARVCAGDAAFAAAARPVVSSLEARLRRQAASQDAESNDVHALLSGTTLADVLERSLAVVGVRPDPSRSDIY